MGRNFFTKYGTVHRKVSEISRTIRAHSGSEALRTVREAVVKPSASRAPTLLECSRTTMNFSRTRGQHASRTFTITAILARQLPSVTIAIKTLASLRQLWPRVGGVHLKGANSMAASGLNCRNDLVGNERAISVLFGMNESLLRGLARLYFYYYWSKPYTSMTSLHMCVCTFACWLACLDRPLTVNHFQLLFVHFTSCVNLKRTPKVEQMNPSMNPWTVYLLSG